ncbi:MAG: hypothetical protein ACOCZ2_04940, partial [Thermodesulfobacteriota bacterium]
LPQNVQIEFPDYRILELDYDREEERSSWYIDEGDSEMDVLRLSLDNDLQNTQEVQVKWNLLMRPELFSSSIRLPALPQDIKGEIDTDWDNQRLNIFDFGFANGYLDFVRKYNNGTDPFSDASKYFKGYREENL